MSTGFPIISDKSLDMAKSFGVRVKTKCTQIDVVIGHQR